MPETEIRGLRYTTLRTRGNFGKPIQEGVPGLQQGSKAKLSPPTHTHIKPSEAIVTSRSPSHDLADRQLRLENALAYFVQTNVKTTVQAKK